MIWCHLEVLGQQVLGAGDDVERLGAVAPVTDLEILVADADEAAVVTAEHLGVEEAEQVDQQLTVAVVLGELRRIQPFPATRLNSDVILEIPVLRNSEKYPS